MFFILKITKGNNFAKRYNCHTNHIQNYKVAQNREKCRRSNSSQSKSGHTFICTKFREIISKPYQSYRADTISMPEIKMGNNSANYVSGVTSFNHCKMDGHVLHCTKFCEIISNGIKVIERTRFLY